LSTSVSVVICTYSDERWHDLGAALASLQRQTVPPEEVIVIVDHNQELLQRVRLMYPWVAAAENTGARGLSEARNRGIELARSRVVAFLDDDAIAGDRWIEALLVPYADGDVVAVGGTITPEWSGSGRPSWFPSEFDWVVGCSYRGQPETTSEVRNLIGCNMSFLRSVLVQLGGFRSEIGRVGLAPTGCEETELCVRARAFGKIVYHPAAQVAHRVHPGRQSFRYLVSRCLGEGRSKAAVAELVGTDSALSTERAYTLHTLPAGVARNILAALHGDGSGIARAAVICTGLICTATGYGLGRMPAWTGGVSLRRASPVTPIGDRTS
jgi:GT2 family glycosyltransferase